MTHRQARSWIVVFAISGATLGVRAQTAESLRSPEVLPGNRVAFRVRAPNAKDVQLALEGADRLQMTRDANGNWSVTTPVLEADLYAYSFFIDGVGILDPLNPSVRPNLLNPQSVAHVPGSSSLPWEVRNAARGTIHQHSYRSQVIGDTRDFYVYTPPGYDARGRRRYPVVYLQHGYSGDARGWLGGGLVNVILDNLIAEKKAEPMLAVMSLGYGVRDFVRRTGPDLSRLKQNYDGFKDTLLTEVMPRVEAEYRVQRDRRGRAIAGVSMGATEALYVGLNTPDRFAWVGAFSAGGMLEHDIALPSVGPHISRAMLLWIACGTEDPLIRDNRELRAWLKARGVGFTAVETAGMHTWMVWRRNFIAFAQLLFREASQVKR